MCEVRWGVGDIWLAIQGCDLFLRKAADLADRLLLVQFSRTTIATAWAMCGLYCMRKGSGSPRDWRAEVASDERNIGGPPLERAFQHPGAGPDGADDLGGRFCKILVCA